MTTYRLGTIGNGDRRPLINNDTDKIVATVVSSYGPGIMGNMTIEQVQGEFGVLLADYVAVVSEETEGRDAVYSVDLPGRPRMFVTASPDPVAEGFRRDTDDQRLALAAVRQFTDPLRHFDA